MKSPIPFKCPYNAFSCTAMEDWTVEPTPNCTDCPHKHPWVVEKGITPDTDIYKMPNGLRVIHRKDLNRAYVQSSLAHHFFTPINTEPLTESEWSQTLLGIAKL